MNKEQRIVRCPGCLQKARISITSEQYGHTLKIVCPRCKVLIRVTISVPVEALN